MLKKAGPPGNRFSKTTRFRELVRPSGNRDGEVLVQKGSDEQPMPTPGRFAGNQKKRFQSIAPKRMTREKSQQSIMSAHSNRYKTGHDDWVNGATTTRPRASGGVITQQKRFNYDKERK